MTIRPTVRSNHLHADNQGLSIDQSNNYNIGGAVFTRLTVRLKTGSFLRSPSQVSPLLFPFSLLCCAPPLDLPVWFSFGSLGLEQSSGNTCPCIWSASLAMLFLYIWSPIEHPSFVTICHPLLRCTNQVGTPCSSFPEALATHVLTPLNLHF